MVKLLIFYAYASATKGVGGSIIIVWHTLAPSSMSLGFYGQCL